MHAHFGFQITGSHFLDFTNLHLEADKHPEDLFQRLKAFVEDTLLSVNSLSHHGEVTSEDEELAPTLENFIVLTWLKLIHPELIPSKLVKQRYRTELKSRILASIEPEISLALSSLLDQIRAADDAKIMCTTVINYRNGSIASYKTNTRPNCPTRPCMLCKQASRPDNAHSLCQCGFLPEQDRKYIAKARQMLTSLMIPLNSRPAPV